MSIHYATERCADCGASVKLEVTTVDGRLIEYLIEGCAHERKRRGVCKRCPSRVDGVKGRAEYCRDCRKGANRESDRRSKRRQYDANPAKFQARARQARKRNAERAASQLERLRREYQSAAYKPGGEKYQQELARRREQYQSDPEYRAMIQARQAEYRARKRAETDDQPARRAA